MRPDPATIKTLADCARSSIAAADGRGRRTQIRLATMALIVAGTRPTLAEQCARAAAAVGAHVKTLVEAAPR